MPEHHIPRGRLHEDLRSLDRDGEDVVTVMPDPDDDDRFLVVTRYKSNRVEVRPADVPPAAITGRPIKGFRS